MSDITIPGVNGGLNIDSMVSKLMEIERIPLERKKEEIADYKDEKTIWQDLTKDLSNLETKAKSLYGSNNPFMERIVESSNEKVLTATAERGALEQEKEITVLKKASSDRFLSESIDDDFDAPSGKYSFSVGDTEINFNYRGGSIKRLAERINKSGEDKIRAQIVKNTPETSVMLIESTVEGSKNQLVFNEGAALDFAKQAGFVKQSDPSLRSISPIPSQDSSGVVITENNTTLLSPGAKGQFLVQPPAEDGGNTWLELEVTISEKIDNWSPQNPIDPDKPSKAGIELKGITIDNAESLVNLPEVEEPVKPEKIVDFNVFSSESNERVGSLNQLKDTNLPQKLLVKLSDIGGSVTSVNFNNKNTHKEITISSIKFFDPDVTREWEPVNPLNKASDSVIEVDGIEITRESNNIDDVIPGVNLSLKEESDEPIELKITTDKDLIKDGIIKFVGTFNRIQAQLSILTSNDDAVISEIDYFTEDETSTARERLGRFQGDSTLIQIKSRLQTILMDPYSTSTDENLRLLSQIGISTNSGGFSGGFNKSQLRGYIEINEEKLDKALETNINGVKELFGSDTNGDLIIDEGAAYKTQNFTKAYSGSNGIFSFKISTLDTKMNRTQREIASYEIKLEDKEAELKNKYAQMEGALNSMQQTSNSLQNFGNTNNK